MRCERKDVFLGEQLLLLSLCKERAVCYSPSYEIGWRDKAKGTFEDLSNAFDFAAIIEDLSLGLENSSLGRIS